MLPFHPKPPRANTQEKQLESDTPYKVNQQFRCDSPQIRLDGDVENRSEASMTPADPVNYDPDMPLAAYRAPSALPSEDLTSSGGPSLALPTLATLDNEPTPLPELSPYPELEDIRNVPFEIESDGSSMLSSTVVVEEDQDSPFPLPWKSEFRWEDGVLYYALDRLKSALVTSRQSVEISSATVGGSYGISESTHASAALVSRPSDVTLHNAVHLEEQAYWARKQRRGNLVRILLAHYRKTHTSQGVNQRNQETSQQITNFPRSTHYTTAASVRPSTGGGPSRRLVNRGGSGGCEDDDPDDGDDRFRHVERPVLDRTRHFACPFQKWRPYMFTRCFYRFRNVSEVKGHVIKKHYAPRCPQCHCKFRTKLALTAHHTDTGCGTRPTPGTTPGHISEEQLAIIRKRPYKRSLEEQWRDLFATIFPNEPQPPEVYVDRRADKTMKHIAHNFQRCCRRVLQKHQTEQVRDDPLWGQFDTLETQGEAVAEELITELMLDLHDQETSGCPPPFNLRSDLQNYDPGTIATGSNLFPLNNNQNQSLAHGYPLTIDYMRQNHSESTGLCNLQPLGTSHDHPLHPNWHLGSQFTTEPINLSNLTPAALDYQPMTTHVMGRELHLVPQLEHGIDAQLHLQPDKSLSAVASQYMLPPGLYSSNNDGNINQALPINYFTFTGPPFTGPPFLPGTHELAPMVEPGSCLYAPAPTIDACHNGTTTALNIFHCRYRTWVDAASNTPSRSD